MKRRIAIVAGVLALLAALPAITQVTINCSRAGVFHPSCYSLNELKSSTSAQLRALLSDESGTGAALFAGGDIGAATGTRITLSAQDAIVGESQTTGAQYGYFNNTSGSMLWGVDSSAGGTLLAGTAAYSSVIRAPGGRVLHLGADNTLIATVSSTGVAVTGLVSATKAIATGTAPSMGACGTDPSVAGKDEAMLVTVGTGGAATSCAVTFGAAYTNAPTCVAQNDTDRVAYSIATTTTTVTVTAAAAFTASSKFHVLCRSYS